MLEIFLVCMVFWVNIKKNNNNNNSKQILSTTKKCLENIQALSGNRIHNLPDIGRNHSESPIAQRLERPTRIWKVMALIPTGGSDSFPGTF